MKKMIAKPGFKDLLAHPALLPAFGFGAGLAPVAPGTFGTLVAIPLYLLMVNLGMGMYWLVTAVLLVVGIWICGRAAEVLGVHDHKGIVWDEIVGYLITMGMLPTAGITTGLTVKGWLWIGLGFALFRFFDIVKPWPIGMLDKQLKGGLGIMLDDVVAGVFALCVMALSSHLWALVV